jgi:hypothetical protein
MPRVKQASTRKRKSKATAVQVLGAAGLGFSLAGSATASTTPSADIPQSDKTSHNQRLVLGEEEMDEVSLATFYLFDRENNVGSNVLLARGCGGCGHGCGGCRVGGCGGCRVGGCGCRIGGCGCRVGGCGGCGIIACIACVGCAGCAGCAGCCLSWGSCRLC